MADRFQDALFTPSEVSQYLLIPQQTVYNWLGEDSDQPLVHRVTPEWRGAPSVPFISLVEAYVLRSLRELRLSKRQIREAADAVRKQFDTPYALASKRIATDGIDIFIDHADGDMSRAGDDQRPIRAVIESHLRYIAWSDSDDFASQLRLQQYPDSAKVIIDPRFGWGAPVIERNRVPVSAVVDLFGAGEPISTVADEYDLSEDEVQAICRVAVGGP